MIRKMARTCLIAFAMLASLSAGYFGGVVCWEDMSSDPEHAFVMPPHTVTWYHAHPDAAGQRTLFCEDNPGFARHDPDCASAQASRGDN
jgi:hypothetical protein